jgi:glycosyltransferase involved in cell wall biosynthesis
MTSEVQRVVRAHLRRIATFGLPDRMHGVPWVSWSAPLADEVWRDLLGQVDRRRLAGLLQAAVDAGVCPVSVAQRRELGEIHLRWSIAALDLEVALLEAVDLLRAAEMEVIVLKGAAHAHLLYPDPAWRLFGDNDLLLRGPDIARAVGLLRAVGYVRVVPELRPGFDARFGKGVTLRRSGGGELDLHRTLLFGTFGLLVDTDELFGSSQAMDLAETSLGVLGAETRLLHLCYHAALGDSIPKLASLRDLAQAYAAGGHDERASLDLARRWGALPVVQRALDLLRTELGVGIDGLLAEAARSHLLGSRDRRAIAAYVGPDRGHTAKVLGSLPYLDDPLEQLAFVRSAALPRMTVRRAFGADRATWLARGVRSVGRSLTGARPKRPPLRLRFPDLERPGGGTVKTKVLWLTKGLGLGGAERLLTLTAARLDSSRFEVDVAYVLPWKDAFVPELEAAGVPTICLEATGTADPRWALRLRRLLASERYDIVHTHSPVPAAAARMLVRRPTMLVHTEHNLWDRYRWPTFAANAVTYARNDAVLAVSDGVAGSVVRPWWARLGDAPEAETLLHGVAPDGVPHGATARAAAREALGLPAGTPVLGCVANLTPKKDHASLLEAFADLRTAHPSAVLLLLGAGPSEMDLRAKAATLELGDSVRFLGSRSDVLDLLPAFDVFVLSSRYEGLPISLLEAMAAEVACVVTRVGGIPEVVTDGVDGRLVEPGDEVVLADALTEVLSDAEERARLARAGRARVISGFSIDRAVERTERLYEELLSR